MLLGGGALFVTVIDCGSRKVDAIVGALVAAGAQAEVVALGAASSRGRSDALVISGGPRLFTQEPELVREFGFLDEVTVPVLGICLGHQALGLREGARIFLGAERRGVEPISVLAPHPLFDGLGVAPVFAEDHCEGIALPSGWRCLARSAHYEVEAMVHEERRRVGVQFHPEVSGATGARLFANFVAFARGVGAPRSPFAP